MATEIPPEVQAAADRLGVDVGTLMQHVTGQPAAEQPVAEQPPAEAAALPAEVATAPAETENEKLQRELAESRQETQQVRRMAEVADQGRVVGSGGQGTPTSMVADLPNIGMIEPGIRYEYLNGLITEEELAGKVGTLLAALLKKHEGGTI